MTSRRLLAAALAALALAASAPARAGDETPQQVKDAIAYFDKYAPKAKDAGKYAELVHDLVTTEDPAAALRIGQILLRDKDPDHRQIAADALSDFGKKPAAKEAAGKALEEALRKADLDEDSRISVVDAIGKLPYPAACAAVCELLLRADDQWTPVRCVRALGNLKDLHALPSLLELLERFPPTMKWGGGGAAGNDEVVVDTGASGDADQKEAERQYNEKHAGDKSRGRAPVVFRQWVQEMRRTIRKITKDDAIDSAKDLRAWMEAHAEELKAQGIEIPKAKGAKK